MGDEIGNAPPRPAGLEIFDELVHGPDKYVRALQELLDAQLGPTKRQFLGSFPASVRYDDSLHERVQFESLISVSGDVSHKPDSVVDDRRFPRREIRLRPTASKSDTREADDVGFLRGEGEELRTVAANENWRVRLLHGDRERTRLKSSHRHISYARFFFNDTATTEISPLPLHDALPICLSQAGLGRRRPPLSTPRDPAPSHRVEK